MGGFIGHHVALKHGAGGRAMRDLIAEIFIEEMGDAVGGGLAGMEDGAVIPVGDKFLVVTTDSHVVHPRFFPGGDIGRLSICGTVNDLSMMGATEPLALTCAVVLEEGLPMDELRRVRDSMKAACLEAGARVVTGDTKVMGKGEVDGLVLNTTGVAIADRVVGDKGLQPGDRLIVTGTIGDHGMAVMSVRHDLKLQGDLRSDVAPLNGLVRMALKAGGASIVAMKDPTRGGVASVLHEFAQKSSVGILLDESAVPVRQEVRAAADLLGIDPLVVANEGKAVIAVRPDAADKVLAAIKEHPLGREARLIGTVTEDKRKHVILDTGFGRRLLAEPEGEPMPRIC